MPVVACPHCRAELDLDPDDIGHRVECPGCLTHFIANRRPAPPAPPADPPADASPAEPGLDPPADPPPAPPRPVVATPKRTQPLARRATPSGRTGGVTLKCPACLGEVSVDATDLGQKVSCPLCQQVFRAEDPDRGRRASRRDDEPSWRRDSRRSSYRDDDDRPSRRRGFGSDEPYESPEPKAWVWQAKRDMATPGGGLQVLGWLDVVYGGLYVLIGVLMGAVGPNGGGPAAPTWEVIAMTIGLGVSGILMGGVKAFGGRCMKRVQNRRLGLIACFAACLPIYLLAILLAFFGPQYVFVCCPAVFTFPSYVIGIVFGIMGLTKLFGRNLQKAYEVNRPGGDIDTV